MPKVPKMNGMRRNSDAMKNKTGFIKILKHFTSGDKINEDDLKIFSLLCW
jgi:hypothetical protein